MNIKDIAGLAQVSTSTVSKVINGRDKDISEATRQKVQTIVRQYQYAPYANVNVNPCRINTLGLVLPARESNAFSLLFQLQRIANDRGYSVLITCADEDTEEALRHIRLMLAKRVQGIILACPKLAEPVAKLIDKNTALLLLDNCSDLQNADIVYSSAKQAGYIACRYLIDQGHREIAYLTSEDAYPGGAFEGYKRALYEHEIPFFPHLYFCGATSAEAGNIGTHQFLEKPVTAFLCSDSEVAYSVCRTLQNAGRRVPDDYSVASCADSSFATLASPAITAAGCATEALAKAAIDAILQRIEGAAPLAPQKIMRPPELVLRESVAPPTDGRGASGKIIVVGSMNIDTVVHVPRLPTAGETVLSSGVTLLSGGKGANQSVGAGKLDGQVYAIGCLGGDADGKKIYSNLLANRVNTEGVIFHNDELTGHAFISVPANGESTITVYPGANQRLDERQIKKCEHLFNTAAFCLLSPEIPMKAVRAAIRLCKKKHVQIMLKPAALETIEAELLCNIDFLIPNEKELHALLPGSGTIEEKAELFFQQGVRHVIVTLGARGGYVRSAHLTEFFPASDFTPVDTTGAADAFISALAVYLSEGKMLSAAIRYASYAAGISVTREGVQNAMADRATMELYRQEIVAELDTKE